MKVYVCITHKHTNNIRIGNGLNNERASQSQNHPLPGKYFLACGLTDIVNIRLKKIVTVRKSDNQSVKRFLNMELVPNHKFTHEENRSKICTPCGHKIVNGKRSLKRFSVTENLLNLIKKFVNGDFDISNSTFPLSVCNSCRNTLNEYGKKVFNRPCPVMPNYNDMYLRKNTRLRDGTCDCYICVTARFNGHAPVRRGRGVLRDFSSNVDICTRNQIPSHMLAEVEEEISSPLIICPKCFEKVHKIARHACKISTSAIVSNVSKIIEDNVPEKQQEQVISRFLKRKLNANSVSEEGHGLKGVTLTTLGAKMTVQVNAGKLPKPVFFSPEKLDNFQLNVGLSANKMKLVTNFLQSVAGQKAVPPHFSEHVREKSKILENVYKHDIL